MADNKQMTVSSEWTSLKGKYFYHSTDGKKAPWPTAVRLKADAEYLHIAFACEKDAFVHENGMTAHNQPLYNQEVFEIFIAPGAADPARYLEVELNPNNALWIGRISYPSLGEKSDMKGELIPYAECGIRHSAEKGEGRWSGTMSIPWSLIGVDPKGVYRVNFYRIVSKKSHPKKDWTCDVETCDFVCWNATMSGKNPAFHRPKRFGTMRVTP